jgi:hypothetical protein
MQINDSPLFSALEERFLHPRQADGLLRGSNNVTGGGKRSEPGVPHKGWYVLEIKEAATWKGFDRHK